MSKLETNTIDTVSGTSTLQVGSTNTSTITLGVSGDTINVPSGVTIANSGTATGFGGTMTPAFEATLSSNQAVSDNANTKLAANTEIYDTDNAYDNSSNYRFTPQVAGKYFFYGSIYGDPQTASDLVYVYAFFSKNGTGGRQAAIDTRNNNGREWSVPISAVIDMNGSSDYVELFGNVNAADGAGMQFRTHSYFGAYKIIE